MNNELLYILAYYAHFDIQRKGHRFIMRPIILASASPRRREILASLGVKFTVLAADADEACTLCDPAQFAKTLAGRKGRAVFELLSAQGKASDAVILSADTVVVCDGEILGKPRDRDDACRMLRLLRGRTHHVITGIGVTVDGVTHLSHSDTSVRVADIPDDAIERYVDSGDPMDKAGAYGIQGAFSRWISGIDGCYFGVVGLPIHALAELYEQAVGEPLC